MSVTHDRFKAYTKEWFEFISAIGVEFKDSPITLYEYIKLRAGV